MAEESDAPAGLRPPKRFLKFAYNHWVERHDTDGHRMGLEVWQWQPQAQKWCRPNQYGIGGDFDKDLEDYHYVALCPTPPLQQEVDVAKCVYDRLLSSPIAQAIPQDQLDTFKRLCNEHFLRVNP